MRQRAVIGLAALIISLSVASLTVTASVIFAGYRVGVKDSTATPRCELAAVDLMLSASTVMDCDEVGAYWTSDVSCVAKSDQLVIIVPSAILNSVDWTRNAVDELLLTLQGSRPQTKVALVIYDHGSIRTAVQLTSNYTAVSSAVRRFVRGNDRETTAWEYDGDFESAAAKAIQVLEAGGSILDLETRSHVVFFASLDHTAAPAQRFWKSAARAIRAEGATLVLAVPASRCCADPMIESLESPALYVDEWRRDPPDTLAKVVLGEIDRQADRPRIAYAHVQHELPTMMQYIPGSAQPEPQFISSSIGGAQQLHWEFSSLRSGEQLSVTYRARPLGEGIDYLTGSLTLSETSGAVSVLPLPSRAITVSGLCNPPTATPTSTKSPTYTPRPINSPTFTSRPTRTPPSTATADSTPVYMPMLLRESCQPGQRRADVVLVIDASTSMLQITSANRSKLDAARDAAIRLVGEMDLESGDQVGLIAFSETVTMVVPLSADATTIEEAIASIEASAGTCIPCAVERARAELTGPGHDADSTPAMVLLTDGQSTIRPIEVAIGEAKRARDLGVKIFVVGLGRDVEESALRRMVSRPEYYYSTLDAEALSEIFSAILTEIPCPVSSFWGGR